jgi:prepilin-type N-terminal cleavage/methylation domain-containing protein
MRNTGSFLQRRRSRMAGFTLIELLLAMAIFGVISAAAFGLMAQHQPLFNQQQGLAALNISMRNAVAQMQTDIVNGGAGYISTVNTPNWPVGVVITNPIPVVSSTQDCHSGTTYGANCFDQFTVIAADLNTPPVNPLASGSTSGSLPVVAGTCATTTVDTSSSITIYVLPPALFTAATFAAQFQNGDQILLVKASGSNYTTVRLTSAPTTVVVSGTTYVLLTHSVTTAANGTNAASDDETNMSVHSSDQTTAQFCAADYVIRLAPVIYYVDISSDSTNPTLRRLVFAGTASAITAPGSGVALANQIIGFKVGAALVSNNTATYNFDASTFGGGAGYDYTQVRSVMISLVGRTPPVQDPTFVFRNTFDGGPYQIQGVSIVVNPRNMSSLP